MPSSDAGNPRLDALSALLASAKQLAEALEADPIIGRVLQALASLPPDDRQTIAQAIERGAAWRRVNESVSAANGVRLRANPNPRLFVRVVDGAAPVMPLAPDPDDVLVSILRVLRLAPLVATDEARAVWEPAASEALGMLEPSERQACLAVGHVAMALIEALIAKLDGPSS
jgi:hypothetical protein